MLRHSGLKQALWPLRIAFVAAAVPRKLRNRDFGC